jgi:hypothetical protein
LNDQISKQTFLPYHHVIHFVFRSSLSFFPGLTATPHTSSGLRKLIHQLHRPQDDISLISRSSPNTGIALGVIGIFRHRAMQNLHLQDIQLAIVNLTIAQLIIFQESES